jgi:hypothetical protein
MNATDNEVRFSSLKNMAVSPAHYLYRLDRQQGQKRGMSIGTGAHALVLGGQAVIAYPGKTRRGKEWEAFKEENSAAIILSRSEMDVAVACADSIRRHRQAMLMLEGTREKELKRWTIANRACGGRPDVVNDRAGFITELKTSVTAEPWKFSRRVAIPMGYHAQLDWYANGARLGSKADIRELHVVCVETAPPFPVTCFTLTPEAVVAGAKLWSSWFERLLVCEASNEWPAYVQHVVPLDVPDLEDVELTYGENAENGTDAESDGEEAA